MSEHQLGNHKSEVPSRETIEATVTQMRKHLSAGDWRAWAGFFAEDGIFSNAALPEPLVGRETIVESAAAWPLAENVIEWRVIEGARMAIGWRERRMIDNDRQSDWYRGFSTFLFNGKGEVQEYEGMFDLLSIQRAFIQDE